MGLTVLNVAYPLAPVGDDAVGGAEQVLTMIDRALVRAGHKSIVIAPEGSCCEGEHVVLPAQASPFTEDSHVAAHSAVRRAIEHICRTEHVDVIHLHGVDFYAYLAPDWAPVLVTLHLPISWYPFDVLGALPSNVHLQCVSSVQREMAPSGLRFIEDIPNGIALDRFLPSKAQREDFVLALGRMCPEKGYHLAVEAARAADVPLVIAGAALGHSAHLNYFKSEVAPRLDERRRFVGPVGFQEKRRLLAKASCLLIPSLVPETSSLVCMEALASGTPVVAFARGALKVLVEHGRTGFLADDVRGMAEGIRNARTLDPTICRESAERRFSSEDMTDRYLDAYLRLAGRRRKEPRFVVKRRWGAGPLAALESDWLQLWERCPGATPFQHPAWLLHWARWVATGTVWSLEVREDGVLRGLAILEDADDGVARLAGGSITDYRDVLAEDMRIANILIREMRARSAGAVELGPMRADSLLRRSTVCALSEVAPRAVFRAASVPFSRSLQKRLKYERARLRRLGASFIQADPADPLPLLQALFTLHEARWKARGKPGVLGGLELFHSDVARAFARCQLLRLFGLELEGRVVAAFYGFADRDWVYYYLGGFDPRRAQLSVGTVLLAHVMEEAAREGKIGFDFLRGTEAYKYEFGACDQPLFRCRNPAVLGRGGETWRQDLESGGR